MTEDVSDFIPHGRMKKPPCHYFLFTTRNRHSVHILLWKMSRTEFSFSILGRSSNVLMCKTVSVRDWYKVHLINCLSRVLYFIACAQYMSADIVFYQWMFNTYLSVGNCQGLSEPVFYIKLFSLFLPGSCIDSVHFVLEKKVFSCGQKIKVV